jgi:uncharacterized protein (DUF1810 family)
MTMPPNPHDLARFTTAQDPVYTQALAELTAGHKRTHWMWFIFPQAKGLGSSRNSTYYGIGSPEEARAYLAHPLLGPRLVKCTEALLKHDGHVATNILGAVDALKLHSSLTLFTRATTSHPALDRALQQCFAGEPDPRTLAILEQWSHDR